MLEPVQGEAGVIRPPAGYLAAVQAMCRRHGALLVVDEIQTGLGRTGRWWGGDHESLTPDLMLVGKGLSGGVVPAAAVLATRAAYAPFDADPFLHSSTFAGSPLACAAALAAVRVIEQEGLVERSRDIGARLLEASTRSSGGGWARGWSKAAGWGCSSAASSTTRPSSASWCWRCSTRVSS